MEEGEKMSVLLKGMELPNNCGECRLMEGDRCYAMDLFHQIGPTRVKKRPEWCPLDEVPQSSEVVSRKDVVKMLSTLQSDLKYGVVQLQKTIGRMDYISSEIPAVRPEVITCKDCEYAVGFNDDPLIPGGCTLGIMRRMWYSDDFYCGFGVRNGPDETENVSDAVSDSEI